MSPREVEEQALKFSSSIGRGCAREVLLDLAESAEEAEPTKFFKDRWAVRFWYEKLYKEGMDEKARNIADCWVMTESNLQRAAAQVNRPTKPPNTSLVRAYGVYRFKEIPMEEWKPLRGGAGIDEEPDTLVCIALEDLDVSNGFILPLQCGQDVCVDGKDPILVPPTGGGLVLLVWVNI